MQEVLKAALLSEAEKGAEKLCSGPCPHPCPSNGKRMGRFIGAADGFGRLEECPVDKYKIKPDYKKFRDNPFTTYRGKEFAVTKTELFSLCALCAYSEVVESPDEVILNLDGCYADRCSACPVDEVRINMEIAETDFEYLFPDRRENKEE